MGLMLVLIVIASIETNKGPDGLYTSAKVAIKLGCQNSDGWWKLPAFDRWMGIVSAKELDARWLPHNQTSLPVLGMQGNNVSMEETFWLYNFTGFCLGHVDDM
jgi:hypothetical protein